MANDVYLVYLLATHFQVDEQRLGGLDLAWSWLARFLNALPATRASAKALISFLKPAGFAMQQR